MHMKKIVVVDYGMGNLRSVAQALFAVAPTADVLVSKEASDLRKADRVVPVSYTHLTLPTKA